MADVRAELERLGEHVVAGRDAFERLDARRRRRARRRRIGAGVIVAAVLAAGAAGALTTLDEGRGHPGTAQEAPFVPIWPETSFEEAAGAQDAFESGFGTIPSWRGDAVETATHFASDALGWGGASADASSVVVTIEAATRVTVATPAAPCPSPPAGEPLGPMCAPRTASIDLRQVAPDGIWSVVGVRGDVLTELSLDVDTEGNATFMSVTSNDLADRGLIEYFAVTGVGTCRGWEVDGIDRNTVEVLEQTIASAPVDRPDGCDAVVLVFAIADAGPVPRNLGQQVMFGDGPAVPIADVVAAPAHVRAAHALDVVEPVGDALQIRCDGDIALDRDTVVARPDGVQIVVTNGIPDTPTTFDISPDRPGEVPVSHTDVRGGDRFDWTWTLAPGRYVATCRYPTTPAGDARSASVSFEVTDPNGVFVDPSLECEGGSIYEIHPPPTPDPTVQAGDPQEAVESHLEGLGDDDTVMRAGGYPDQGPTIVTIDRNGHVIGSVSFFDTARGSYFVDTIRGCAGTTFAWSDRETPS